MIKSFYAVFAARNREFLRDRGSLMWNIVFPVMLIAGFAVAFGRDVPSFQIGVLSQLDAYANPPAVMSMSNVAKVYYNTELEAVELLRRHQLDLVVDLDQRKYWVNEESYDSEMLETLLVLQDPTYRRSPVVGEPIRYVDWVIPGVLSMNIMFASLFGVGYALVRYRKNGVLKRLRATPIKPLAFIAAHMASRLLIVICVCSVLLVGAKLTIDVQILGSLWLLLLIAILGGLSLISLSIAMIARVRSEEFASGLINLTSWPMMLLSGVWFPLSSAPDWLTNLSYLLPLSHMVEAARAVMTEGASIERIYWHLVILAIMTVCFMLYSAKFFTWDSDHR
ncbi:ABC transporter permease [Salinibius halmophilus]|uniref:ABC transporter permease n=1 Tax=Salinibius halmophilus TaxID=1853216 RepID=UPI001F202C00|nr:ABC transporter permease [Salinibius halmophilus]